MFFHTNKWYVDTCHNTEKGKGGEGKGEEENDIDLKGGRGRERRLADMARQWASGPVAMGNGCHHCETEREQKR